MKRHNVRNADTKIILSSKTRIISGIQNISRWWFFVVPILFYCSSKTKICYCCWVDATTDSTTGSTHCKINTILNQLQTWQLNFRTTQQQTQQQQQQHRPFITAAFAQSIDGYMAPYCRAVEHQPHDGTVTNNKETESKYPLSGNESLMLTHALRSVHDGIMIGGRTLLIDNPRLNNRLWGTRVVSSNSICCNSNSREEFPQHQPQPVILDPTLRYLKQLLSEQGNYTMNVRNPIICCSYNASSSMMLSYDKDGVHNNFSPFKIIEHNNDSFTIVEHNKSNNTTVNTIRLLPCQCNEDDGTTTLNMTDVLQQLYHRCNIRSIMVEGGARTLSKLFATTTTKYNTNTRQSVVDVIIITISPQILNDGIRPMYSTIRRKCTESKDYHSTLPLVPSSSRFVVLGNDATMIAWCNSENTAATAE